MFSCFIIFVNVSFIFYYSTFYGKMALPAINYEAKLPTAKMLTVKVLQAHSCMAAVAKGKWTLSSFDWLALCALLHRSLCRSLSSSALSASHSPVTSLPWNCDPCFMDSELDLSDDFCGQSHLVKSKPG